MFKPKITLSQLLIVLTIFTALLIIGSSVYGNYDVTKQTFVDEALHSNLKYTAQVAQATHLAIESTAQQVEKSASTLSSMWQQRDHIQRELQRLQLESFQQALLLTPEGTVIAQEPTHAHVSIPPPILERALQSQSTYISTSFRLNDDTLAILITHPIQSDDRERIGTVAAILSLHNDTFIQQLIPSTVQQHDELFIVDSSGIILYDQQKERIGLDVSDQFAVEQVTHVGNGAIVETLQRDEKFVTAYAVAPTPRWGVVWRQEYETIITPTKRIVLNTITTSLPFIALSLVLVLLTTMYVTKPLRQIASIAERSSSQDVQQEMNEVKAWYYEAYQMKQSIEKSIGTFQDQVSYYHTQSIEDPLTGLTNRRTMDKLLEQWIAEDVPFVILLIDLDHFKRVNDTYGHTVGDDVLRYLATQMQQVVDGSPDEICCRYGGEEFVILYKERPLPYVVERAETLRVALEQSVSPTGKPVTMSAGIGAYPLHTPDAHRLFDLVDEALYESKQHGRNRTTIVHPTYH